MDMSGSARDQALDVARKATTFTAERLGPCSTSLFQDPVLLALVASRMRAGANLEDTVLSAVFDAAASDAALAAEFLGYFLPGLHGPGEASLSPDLRRFVDAEDLVQSVVGDLWPDLQEITFSTRESFLAFLKQRVRWKAGNRRRALSSQRRSEDRRIAEPVEELELARQEPSPATQVGLDEESSQLAREIQDLAPRDRKIVRLHLRGESAKAIGNELGIRTDAARKALQRALERLRATLGE
jgi:RNA polymerase sigma factor (sigma-70 family)